MFSSVRAKYAYADFSTVPDALVFVALLATYTSECFETNMAEAKRILQKLRKFMNSPGSLSELKFVQLARENLEVVIRIDTFFCCKHQ